MNLILAEAMSWPDAVYGVGMMFAFAFFLSALVTGCWPWERRKPKQKREEWKN